VIIDVEGDEEISRAMVMTDGNECCWCLLVAESNKKYVLWKVVFVS